ncbi:hypothetical protein [Halobaculum gomorrense]|uniref:Uncharacterized protein n=1 Tax=Halobaculum gomorrense TaxID=43928 RepID=A0A1M5ML00_9EURY|nr:hypothetical protein [Halobaculum gomorrense]SHG77926.1 hypothetical protein SAMN05443636_1049 [Halobaculum gomorrense]
MNRSDGLGPIPVITFVGGVSALVAVVLATEYGEIGLSGLDIVVGISLTSALVLLYRRQSILQQNQNDLQRTQTEVLKSQRKMEDAKIRPELVVEDYSFKNNDYVSILVSNYGDGIATNLNLWTCFAIPEMDLDLCKPTGVTFSRQSGRNSSLVRDGSAIEKQQPTVKFSSEARLLDPFDDDREKKLRRVVESVLKDQNTGDSTRVFIKLFLEYEDILGRKYLIPIFDQGAAKYKDCGKNLSSVSMVSLDGTVRDYDWGVEQGFFPSMREMVEQEVNTDQGWEDWSKI